MGCAWSRCHMALGAHRGGKAVEFGELKSAKLIIFIVFYAITRANKCKLAYICCCFAIWRAQKCNMAYIYCAFRNPES